MQNNMHDFDNLQIWERNGGYHSKQYFSQKRYCQGMSTKQAKQLLKWSYDGHLLVYGQMTRVSKPIRLLLQIQINIKKVTHEPRWAITGSWEPLVQHVSIIQYPFSAESYFDSSIASQFFIYSFFQGNMQDIIVSYFKVSPGQYFIEIAI